MFARKLRVGGRGKTPMLWRNLFLSTCLVGTIGGCDTMPSGGPERGEVLYSYCVQCHGAQGQGIEQFKTPAIAGLPAWYVEAQLTKFREGARGDHPDDVDGLRMRPMSRTLKPEDLPLVVEHVAGLSPALPAPTVEGGVAEAGKTTFTTVCVECHGAKGEGKLEKKAPPLVGGSDWYLVSSLAKFKSGVRGMDPQDVTGNQMRAMVVSLSEQQAKDVVAYIMTLR